MLKENKSIFPNDDHNESEIKPEQLKKKNKKKKWLEYHEFIPNFIYEID